MLKKYYEREPVKALGIFDIVEPADILEEENNVKPIPECGVIAEQQFDDEKLLAEASTITKCSAKRDYC